MGKKQSRLEMTVATIQQRYGALALTRGRPALAGSAAPVLHIPTGFRDLDKALGIGGLARGRISEILGPATSGKTTLALKFLVQAQANEGQVGYVDYAHAFDPDYAYRCGLDLSRLLVAVPGDLAEALATTEALATSGALAALVLDAPDTLCNDNRESALLAACLDRIVRPLDHAGTALVFLRAPIARVAAGLSALAHHATVRLYITRARWLRSEAERPAAGGMGNDIRGYEGKVEILKNRLGPAGRAVTITIRFNGTVRGEGL